MIIEGEKKKEKSSWPQYRKRLKKRNQTKKLLSFVKEVKSLILKEKKSVLCRMVKKRKTL